MDLHESLVANVATIKISHEPQKELSYQTAAHDVKCVFLPLNAMQVRP